MVGQRTPARMQHRTEGRWTAGDNPLRRVLPVASVLALVAALLVVVAPPASALSVDVRVTILQVDALDSLEEPGDADFYAITTIDGQQRESDQCQFVDDDHITPNWEFKKEGVDLSRGSVTVTIEIWDDDDPCDEPFSLRGGDDQADITPVDGRALTFSVALAPCALSGGVTAACKTNVQSAGTADDDIASIIFSVAVDEPPSAPGMNIRCWHSPLAPQPGQTVTIKVEYLDGNLQPDVKIADQIQVYLGGNQAVPAGSVAGAEEFTFTTPAVAAPSFSYACRLVDDGIPIWTGWRTVNVGAPPTAGGPIPIMFTGPMASRVDVVFLADSDNYSGPMDGSFQTAVSDVVQKAYFALGDPTSNAALLLTNQDTFNFWLAGVTADAEAAGSDSCPHVVPDSYDEQYAFADVGAILHTDNFRDCAPGGKRLFSSEPTSINTFRHEQGHRPFGLADEYCNARPGSASSVCDGGYFQSEQFPNVYEAGGDCEADAGALGRPASACQQWTEVGGGGDDWETSEPVTGDLMVDNTTPQAADVRRIGWILDTQCASGNC